MCGEARDLGAAIARDAVKLRVGECLVYGGEATVTVLGDGLGWRNQELALAAAIELDAIGDGAEGVTIASVASDGVDGPTDAAGAVARRDSVRRGREVGCDARQALEANDSFEFWRALGDGVVTGATGTNVMDLVVVCQNGREGKGIIDAGFGEGADRFRRRALS
jgi:glycerate 2-kinase